MIPIILSLFILLFPEEQNRSETVWVFFKDKGRSEGSLDLLKNGLSDKTINRRLLNMGRVFDTYDLPVYEKYIDEIKGLGGVLRYRSNWLNAASFRINPTALKKIETLPFIKKIRPVALYREMGIEMLHPKRLLYELKNDTNEYKDFYGPSYLQAAMLNVPPVYFSGYTGSGVTVGMLDTGFKRKHSAVKGARVVRVHDFITGDDFVFDGTTVLTNKVLAQDPALFIDSKGKVHLFYVADTFSQGRYMRPLFWVSASNWDSVVTLSASFADNAAVNPTVTGRDTVFVAWQGFGSNWDNRINFGYYDGFWKGIKFITAGSVPALTQSGDKLFLFYAVGDKSLALKTGTISTGGVDWSQERVLFSGGEPISSTQALVAPSGTVSVFWTELSSGKIFFSFSQDSGLTFSNPAKLDSLAGKVKAVITDNTTHLIYKDYSRPPFVLLAYKNSTNWNNKIYLTGDTVLYLGDYSLTCVGDTISVVFESQGQIYKVESNNNGQSWTIPDLVLGSPAEFACWPRVAADHILWLLRGDANVDYDSTEDNIEQPNHGTRMLSVIGGYQLGQLVGIAPGVDFIIAKTEKFKGLGSGEEYEFIVEEDTWIEGLEWLERSGADLVTSSLGYINWYQYEDMDGKTAPVSIAASLAARRGLLIVNAIGNRGTRPGPYITAPGDAEGIITMGGVLIDSQYQVGKPITDALWWDGSGFGPTADGRMKPELLAPAYGVYAVDPDSTNSYLGGVGTSFATALAAGAYALIKEAHPNWSLDSLKAVLFRTASNYALPSDTLGYGIPNVESAIHWSPPLIDSFYANSLGDPFPNPFVPERHLTVSIPFRILKQSRVELRIYTLSGELVKFIDLSEERGKDLFLPGRYDRRDQNDPYAAAAWDGKNEKGKPVASGIYLVVLETGGFGQDIKKVALVR